MKFEKKNLISIFIKCGQPILFTSVLKWQNKSFQLLLEWVNNTVGEIMLRVLFYNKYIHPTLKNQGCLFLNFIFFSIFVTDPYIECSLTLHWLCMTVSPGWTQISKDSVILQSVFPVLELQAWAYRACSSQCLSCLKNKHYWWVGQIRNRVNRGYWGSPQCIES